MKQRIEKNGSSAGVIITLIAMGLIGSGASWYQGLTSGRSAGIEEVCTDVKYYLDETPALRLCNPVNPYYTSKIKESKNDAIRVR